MPFNTCCSGCWFRYLIALIGGFFLYAELRAKGTLSVAHAVAGLLLGLGGFQLFDGLVNHKIFGLHEVKYGVDLLPYDLVWNGAALLLLIAGGAHLARTRARQLADRPE